MLEIAKSARAASLELRSIDNKKRKEILESIDQMLINSSAAILEANKKDISAAEKNNLSNAMIDRLVLDQGRIKDMAGGVKTVSLQEDFLGQIVEERVRPNGLVVQKELIPLGVVAMIFESRPNVVVDAASLAIKSGNALILKGGKEAFHSNKILTEVIQSAIENCGVDKNCVQQIDTREEISEVLKLNQYIDVVIPRGGEKLINYVYENATMPVIAHFKGLCHLYVHKDADLEKALPIILNAKAQRPGVCNALETLILHRDLPDDFKKTVIKELINLHVELRVAESLHHLCPDQKIVRSEDFHTEYLDLILNVAEVENVDQAIEHINTHGTHHTEVILAEDSSAIAEFKKRIDCSCIIINASTRFNDGGELGLGAELGISTSKFHAYGPMGAKELTTARFLVTGDGQVRT